MKTIIKIITELKLILQVVLVSLMAFSMSSCDPTIDSLKFDLPEANSIPDLTPPSANFVETQTAEDWQTYTFANLSSSATTYAWDFGDGQSATTLDATNTFPGEGEFTVSLTASDDLGVSNTFTKVIEVVEPEVPAAIIPIIGAPDFEDVAGVCGSGDSRDCWRLSGASIHQTTSDGRNGSRGAKYPVSASSQRVTYQGITVSPNTKYTFRGYYALQGAGDYIRVSIIDGQLSNKSEFASATFLAQENGTVVNGKNNYTELVIQFETGANGEIAIYVDHSNTADAYLDDVSVLPL